MDDPFIYLAFGDSITSGNNVRKEERYPAVLTSLAQKHGHRPIYMQNLGRNGLSTTGLLKVLRTRRAKEAVRQADIITVCIGGDDLIYAYLKWRILRNKAYMDRGVEKLAYNFDKICYVLTSRSRLRTVVATFYNPFPNTPFAVNVVEYCNYRIIAPTAARYGLPVADIYAAMRGREHMLLKHYRSGLLEEYFPFFPNSPIHPNKYGYRVIAHSFAEKVFTL